MRQDRKAPKTQGGARDQQALAPVARRGRADFASTDALAHAATALGKAGFSDVSIVMRWREIAGAQLAAIATPIKFAEGPEGATLTLRCEAGAALFLQHQTRALLERLNLYLGAEIGRAHV